MGETQELCGPTVAEKIIALRELGFSVSMIEQVINAPREAICAFIQTNRLRTGKMDFFNSPYTQAMKMKKGGASEEEIAAKLGVNVRKVRTWLSLFRGSRY